MGASIAYLQGMSWLQIIVLALIQGITEFLPISSSGHLILAPHLFGWEDQGLAFDVAVNTGTLLAVVLYFRRDLAEIVREGLGSLKVQPGRWTPAQRLPWALALGTVPVGICGLLLYDWVAGAARNPHLVAATTIGFGILLWLADRLGRHARNLGSLGWGDALVVGLAQALALVPGTSRSGITMTAALGLGFDRRAAARFSFLLAVPVGALAAAKDVWDLIQVPPEAAHLQALLWALVISAVAAYLVIGGLLAWLQRWDFSVFVAYRLAEGLLIFLVL
jgi:undecaprenyl-diphosphatase